jgi:hypothetical protein
VDNKRWIRLSSLYPETINYVEFYRNDVLIDIAYEEPFMVNNESTWLQKPFIMNKDDHEWKAKIFLRDGRILEKVHIM